MTPSTPDVVVSGGEQRGLLNSYELRLMCRHLVEHQDCDLDAILQGSGVLPRQLENPAHRLTLEQELSLYTRIARLNSDPLLGLRVGSEIIVLHHRGSGLVISHGNTLVALGGGIVEKLRVAPLTG